jgi:hypothetical protein
VLDLALGRRPADRGDGDELAEAVDDPLLVHGGEHAGLGGAQVGHGRRLVGGTGVSGRQRG